LTNTYSCEIHLITNIVKSFRVLPEFWTSWRFSYASWA